MTNIVKIEPIVKNKISDILKRIMTTGFNTQFITSEITRHLSGNRMKTFDEKVKFLSEMEEVSSQLPNWREHVALLKEKCPPGYSSPEYANLVNKYP